MVLAAVVDADAKVAEEAGATFGIPWFTSVQDCVAAVKLQAASVCVPTVHHAAAAELLLAAGVDVLVEKPIAGSLADADRILAAARQFGRIVQVGHLERFNPAVTAARSCLNRPMFFESHRLSVFTARSLDVDVVLDLMIHDLDIVLSLVDSPVREVRAVGLPVLSSKVDIANVRVEFENGCIANFTASRVSTERVRKLRFFQPHQYLSLDFARQDLLMIDVTGAAGMSDAQLAALASMTGADQHPSEGLSMRKIKVEAGEPLRLEIESFVRAIKERSTPIVSGKDGRRALALALEIHEAMAAHAKRAGI
ncbi:MAG: oxidoreductase domain protein [Acidobacteriaceae bacterium]|nr:oxidoreductase domain protein [Acidobacteriaceae bacterium]